MYFLLLTEINKRKNIIVCFTKKNEQKHFIRLLFIELKYCVSYYAEWSVFNRENEEMIEQIKKLSNCYFN